MLESNNIPLLSHRPVIGLFVEGLDDLYETAIFQHCRSAAITAGVHFICFSGIILRGNEFKDEMRIQTPLFEKMIQIDSLDGIIFPSMIFNHADSELRTRILEILSKKPCVSIGLTDERIPSIESSNYEGMKKVTEHLLTVHNIRKFAYAYDNLFNPDFVQRKQGFDDAVSRAGIDPASIPCFHFATLDGLTQKILKKKPEIEAVVCVDDRAAKNAIEFCATLGLMVPYDILVTGFDGMTGEKAIPRITTAQQPLNRMSEEAVRVILQKLRGEQFDLRTIVPAELIVLDSCGCRAQRLDAGIETTETGGDTGHTDRQHTSRPTKVLADAIVKSLAEKSPHPFLDALDREVRGGFSHSRSGAYWQRRLSLVREALAASLPAAEDRLALEKLIGMGRMFLCDLLERKISFAAHMQFEKAMAAYSFAGNLARATGFHDIAQVVVQSLESPLSIRDGHLIFFNDDLGISGAGSLLVEKNRLLTGAAERTVTVNGYLNTLLVAASAPRALICNLLKCFQDPVGVSICEAEIPDLEVLLMLRNMVGNQIQMARLFKKIQHQADDLSAANLQLITLRAKEQEYIHAVKRELDLARQIQSDFLPKKLPAPEGWDVAVCFEPAKEVSGDFYDVFVLPEDRIGIVIADVSGKSVSAAMFMALTRGLMRALSLQSGGANLLGVVPAVNDYFVKNHNQTGAIMFVTLFYGVLDTSSGWLEYVNAGHPPPLVLTGTKIREFFKLTGPAIGISENAEYYTGSALLKPGDTLFAYTDGVTEAHGNQGILMGKNKLYTVLQKDLLAPASLIAAVKDEVLKHMQGEDISDDITMVALKRI